MPVEQGTGLFEPAPVAPAKPVSTGQKTKAQSGLWKWISDRLFKEIPPEISSQIPQAEWEKNPFGIYGSIMKTDFNGPEDLPQDSGTTEDSNVPVITGSASVGDVSDDAMAIKATAEGSTPDHLPPPRGEPAPPEAGIGTQIATDITRDLSEWVDTAYSRAAAAVKGGRQDVEKPPAIEDISIMYDDGLHASANGILGRSFEDIAGGVIKDVMTLRQHIAYGWNRIENGLPFFDLVARGIGNSAMTLGEGFQRAAVAVERIAGTIGLGFSALIADPYYRWVHSDFVEKYLGGPSALGEAMPNPAEGDEAFPVQNLKEAYVASRIAYSVGNRGALTEFVERWRDGEDPILLERQYANPVAEAIGQTLFDPLWAVGKASKAAEMARAEQRALALIIDKTGDTARGMNMVDNGTDIEEGLRIAEADVAARAKLANGKYIDVATDTGRGIANRPGFRLPFSGRTISLPYVSTMTSGAKIDRANTVANNLLLTMMDGTQGWEGFKRRILAFVTVSNPAASVERRTAALRVIMEMGAGRTVLLSDTGLEVGQSLAGLVTFHTGEFDPEKLKGLQRLFEGVNAIEDPNARVLALLEGGKIKVGDGFIELGEGLSSRVNSLNAERYPSVIQRAEFADTIAEARKAGKPIPNALAAFVDDKLPPWLVKAAKADAAAKKYFIGPMHKFFSDIYMGLTTGAYPSRNYGQNMLMITIDAPGHFLAPKGGWEMDIINNVGAVPARGGAAIGGPAGAISNNNWMWGYKLAARGERSAGIKIFGRVLRDSIGKGWDAASKEFKVGRSVDQAKEVDRLSALARHNGFDPKKTWAAFKRGDRTLTLTRGEAKAMSEFPGLEQELTEALNSAKFTTYEEFERETYRIWRKFTGYADEAAGEEFTVLGKAEAGGAEAAKADDLFNRKNKFRDVVFGEFHDAF